MISYYEWVGIHEEVAPNLIYTNVSVGQEEYRVVNKNLRILIEMTTET